MADFPVFHEGMASSWCPRKAVDSRANWLSRTGSKRGGDVAARRQFNGSGRPEDLLFISSIRSCYRSSPARARRCAAV